MAETINPDGNTVVIAHHISDKSQLPVFYTSVPIVIELTS